ncbi:uncharacterized protein LOC100142616 [Tribolium castaneum]|uniref:Kazal-like domain-containing protein n=1 Tax=Tribolium castaneum TaxID=7070 RepID=D6W9Q1_TRICA|nr:PREDICTED: uncharacterized protein LOC100142616 [Tribolium castaneum]EEZ98527.1 hypothetical protein TcasGA2_TC001031 [Tribolium castaneum]|eukprot:XP_001814929.1 PREDICTED: uncharacterized protein LOC100142616 [Tribolium castaneum]
MRSCFFIFAFLQATFAYRYELSDDSRYVNFGNSDESRRSSRQLGFDWDNPSPDYDNNFNNRRVPNTFNWNSRQEQNPDTFIFEDDFENRNFVTTQRPSFQIPAFRRTTQRTPSSTIAIPGMGTPRTPCEDRCLSTPEYNPVCGDDNMTYFSMHRLNCARRCGKRVSMKHMGACTRIRQ